MDSSAGLLLFLLSLRHIHWLARILWLAPIRNGLGRLSTTLADPLAALARIFDGGCVFPTWVAGADSIQQRFRHCM